jgi:hypothetical protein
MGDKRKPTKHLSTRPSERPLAEAPPTSKQGVGIDNRNESTRRYGNLEPEGYTRHSHGNREGEYQRGGKAPSEVPIERGEPMKEARFRNDDDKRAVPPDQFGGRTFDDVPGDRDIVDDLLRNPPTQNPSSHNR